MDVTLIYFSQTGSTRKVAEAMAAGFRELGHATRMLSLQKAEPQDAVAGDLVGIGSPCFASQAPTPVKRFLSAVPPLRGKGAFVFATSGGAPGRVLYDLTRLLRDRDANVLGGFLTRGELHYPAPCLIGRLPGRPDEQDLASARHFAQALAEHLAAGRAGPLPESRPDALRAGWGFYDLASLVLTDAANRLLLPEPKLDQGKCDQCQWCVSQCPVQNITLQPYPVLGPECIRCYRCSNGCPQQAFDVDWRFGNLAVWSLYNTAFERLVGDLQPGEKIY